MRIRCIAFLPLASLITCVLFLLASSFLVAIETTLAPLIVSESTAIAGTPTIELIRFETECEGLRRRIEELARDACEARLCGAQDTWAEEIPSPDRPMTFVF